MFFLKIFFGKSKKSINKILTNRLQYCILSVYQNKEGIVVSYMDYIKTLIDFIMKLVSFFKNSDNTETEELPEQDK